MRVYSSAFHTSYQYNLASAFPEIEWTFSGEWSSNRPHCNNVKNEASDFDTYDLFLAHSPSEFISLAEKADASGIERSQIVYVTHWGLQPNLWTHIYSDVDYESFLRDLSASPIVCVSHYMLPQFGFYSDVGVQVIPHFIPTELFDKVCWNADGGDYYINVVNGFYNEGRGVGAPFWKSLPLRKRLFGSGNDPSDGPPLPGVREFKEAVAKAKGYLWTADAVAISFAPLEAMALGCPLIAPDNLDWRIEFEDRREILLYRPNDVASLLERISEFETNRSMARELSARGREAIIDRFSKELFRLRWQRTFDAALSHRKLVARRGSTCHPCRRGWGVIRSGEDSVPYRLVTDVQIGPKSVSVVHPAGRERSVRQRLRANKDHVLVLDRMRQLISTLDFDPELFIDASNNFGVLGILLAEWVRKGLVFATELDMPFVLETCRLNANEGDTSISVMEADLLQTENEKGVLLGRSFLEAHAGGVVLTTYQSGFEPRVIGNLLQIGIHPQVIIANCQPHTSWSYGCSVEALVEKLQDQGYVLEFIDCATGKSLHSEIKPGDSIPKLNNYVLKASLVGLN